MRRERGSEVLVFWALILGVPIHKIDRLDCWSLKQSKTTVECKRVPQKRAALIYLKLIERVAILEWTLALLLLEVAHVCTRLRQTLFRRSKESQ